MNQAGEQLYAEEVNYWQTSQESADTWIERACDLIAGIGGSVVRTAMVTEAAQAGYLIEFSLGQQHYKLMWPVLRPRDGDVKSARRQAATALWHDVKARCVSMKFLGTQAAFLPFLQLSDGRVAAQLGEEAASRLPKLLSRPELPAATEPE